MAAFPTTSTRNGLVAGNDNILQMLRHRRAIGSD